MEENNNVQEIKQKSKIQTFLLICILSLIAFNLYIFFTGTYVIVQETMNDALAIHIPYKNILTESKGFISKFVDFLDAGEEADSLLYEKAFAFALLIGCGCLLVGIIQLPKNKLSFLTAGIILVCISASGLLIIVKYVESEFESTLLGTLFGDLLKIRTDTILHLIGNLIISLFAIYEINKLKNILLTKGEPKNEHPIQPQCNQ